MMPQFPAHALRNNSPLVSCDDSYHKCLIVGNCSGQTPLRSHLNVDISSALTILSIYLETVSLRAVFGVYTWIFFLTFLGDVKIDLPLSEKSQLREWSSIRIGRAGRTMHSALNHLKSRPRSPYLHVSQPYSLCVSINQSIQ